MVIYLIRNCDLKKFFLIMQRREQNDLSTKNYTTNWNTYPTVLAIKVTII